MGVFETATGFLLWDGAISYVSGTSELENLVDSDANPVIEGGLIYTTNYQGKLNIFDSAQRRSIWSYDASSFFSPVVMRGMLVVIEYDSNIQSFSLKNLEKSWNSEEYLNAFEFALNKLREFKPEFVLISAGFDSHKADPLAQLKLETEDFYTITKRILETSKKFCDGKVVSILEGGYDLQALADSTKRHVDALLEFN